MTVCCLSIIHLPARTTTADGVLQAEAGFVAFSHFLERGYIEKVVVNECFEGVIVVVAGMVLPLIRALGGLKVCGAPVHGEAIKAKEIAVGIPR